jgi:acyl-CoA dehydrogenase
MNLDFRLTDEQELFRSAFRDLLGALMTERRMRTTLDGPHFDRDLWQELCAGGWLEVGVADAESDTSLLLVYLCELIGARLVPGPFSLTATMVVPLLMEFEQSELPVSYQAIASGEKLATMVLPSGGSSWQPAWQDFQVDDDRTDALHLWGRAEGVPFGHIADCILVPITRPDGRVVVAALDGHDPNLVRSQDRELDFSKPTGVISIDGLTLAPTAFVNGWEADQRTDLNKHLRRYQLCVSAESIGGAEAALRRTVEYVSQRRQFGVPIGTFQAVKHLLADAWSKIELARSLTRYAAWLVDHDAEDATAAVMSSQIFAGSMYPAVLETCIQCHGGAGFTWEQGLHGWYRQALYYRHHPFSQDSLRGSMERILLRQLQGDDNPELTVR